MTYVALYSKEQKAWHIETEFEYEIKPKNGYMLQHYGTYQECSDFIKANRKKYD
jgi:hypothetical protein